MSTSPTRDRLEEQLSAPVEALGLDLEAVHLSQAGKRRLLRVAIDRDGGVSMDDIADATRVVSRALDDHELMGQQPYTLEVSSPGVDRPLTLPRHWRRNIGRLVKITLSGSEASESVIGRLRSSDETGATLQVGADERHVDFAAVEKAKVQIEFKKEGE